MVGVSSIQKRGKMVYSNAKLIIRIYTKRKKKRRSSQSVYETSEYLFKTNALVF